MVDNAEGAEAPVMVGLNAKVAVFKSLGKISGMASQGFGKHFSGSAMDSKFTHFVYFESLFQPFKRGPSTEIAGLDGDTDPIARFVDPAIKQAAIGLEGAAGSTGPGGHSKIVKDSIEIIKAGKSVGIGDLLDFCSKVVRAFKLVEVALATAGGDDPYSPFYRLPGRFGDFFPNIMKTDRRPICPNGISDDMNMRMVGVKVLIYQVGLLPKSDSIHVVNGDLLKQLGGQTLFRRKV